MDTSKSKPWPENGVLVGGAVRDQLLRLEPRDFDWLVADPAAEAARCAQLTGGSLFCLDEEREHWRVVGPASGAGERVTHDYTPLLPPSERGAIPALDQRALIERDLTRRDLSVNSLALLPSGELIDPTGGALDLKHRRLRATAAANLRSDLVRPLRVARFATTLGFEIEATTRATVIELSAAQAAGGLPLPAPERVGAELDALIMADAAAVGVRLLEDLGLLAVYLPEVAAGRGVEQRGLHHLDVLDHNVEALARLVAGFPDADSALRWATLLHDVAKPLTRDVDDFGRVRFHSHAEEGAKLTRSILRRLRLPSETVERAAGLVRHHMVPLPAGERAARRFVHRRRQLLPDLLKLMLADREAARGRQASAAGRTAYRLAMSRIIAVLEEPRPPAPLLDGDGVMKLLGLPPGPRVGEALAVLAEAVAVGDVEDLDGAERLLMGYARAQGWLVDG